MSLQRNVSPIPPGRYWITVLGEANMREFSAWVSDMAGAVVVESSSLDQSKLPGFFGTQDPFGRHTGPPALFTIFRVPEGRAPFLNALAFGFPNNAPPDVQTVRDVEQSPSGQPDRNPFGLPDFSGLGGVILILLALGAVKGAGSLFGSGGRARHA